jgi:hypothetical protein
MNLDIPLEIYSEATHRAVCEFTDSDGYLKCAQYAVAGCFLMNATRQWHNLGRCHVVTGWVTGFCDEVDPDDPTLGFEYQPERLSLETGEYHTFLSFPRWDAMACFYQAHPPSLRDRIRSHFGLNPLGLATCLLTTFAGLPREWLDFGIDERITLEHLREIRACPEVRALKRLALHHFAGVAYEQQAILAHVWGDQTARAT